MDQSGIIVSHALTEATVDDATTAMKLVAAAAGDLESITADGAYDTVNFYDAAGARGATVVVPPMTTAKVSRRGPRSRARDRTISAVQKVGRRRWKKMAGYHQQARVENVGQLGSAHQRRCLLLPRASKSVEPAPLIVHALELQISGRPDTPEEAHRTIAAKPLRVHDQMRHAKVA